MEQTTQASENKPQSQVGKVIRMVVVSVGALLILFTFIMAIVRKFGG